MCKPAWQFVMLMHGIILFTFLNNAQCTETEITIEAAFQGHCGHTSPCEQLCYEIHDGMYECDCIEGYELNKNGYSCQVINSTNAANEGHSKSDEDVLYQKGALFSAKLANDNINNNYNNNHNNNYNISNIINSHNQINQHNNSTSDALSPLTPGETASFSPATTVAAISSSVEITDNLTLTSDKDHRNDFLFQSHKDSRQPPILYVIQGPQNNTFARIDLKDFVEDDKNSNNNKYVQKYSRFPLLKKCSWSLNSRFGDDCQTASTAILSPASRSSLASPSKAEPKISHKDIWLRYNLAQGETIEVKPHSYDRHRSIVADKKYNISLGVDSARIGSVDKYLEDIECPLDCGLDGLCEMSPTTISGYRCRCSYGQTGTNCEKELNIHLPRFARQSSWLAFPALHDAYKHVQIRIEFRPETYDGVLLLSGERDDLTGDFMALILNMGFMEFWFDCGSGAGFVRSHETIVLNDWNSVIIYRHRWDAWLILNHGNKVQGRSKGLFSRITFREPVFLGGTGNITGLAKRIPITEGFIGCIRRFVINSHEYLWKPQPQGDIIKGYDIENCITDKCTRYPCQHGGKCLTSPEGSICLCPIGFIGDLCETRMDLQMPSFNGSAYLRYSPLGNQANSWLELKIVLKTHQRDGLVLYSGSEEKGTFIALILSNGFVEFIFDLGNGPALIRSEYPLSMGQWHSLKISRTSKLAVLKVDEMPEEIIILTNGYRQQSHISYSEDLFVGGINHIDRLPTELRRKPFLVGCIQKLEINGHQLSIISEALGGLNIGNCPHACAARPCGPLAECLPQMEDYQCRTDNVKTVKFKEPTKRLDNDMMYLKCNENTKTNSEHKDFNHEVQNKDERSQNRLKKHINQWTTWIRDPLAKDKDLPYKLDERKRKKSRKHSKRMPASFGQETTKSLKLPKKSLTTTMTPTTPTTILKNQKEILSNNPKDRTSEEFNEKSTVSWLDQYPSSFLVFDDLSEELADEQLFWQIKALQEKRRNNHDNDTTTTIASNSIGSTTTSRDVTKIPSATTEMMRDPVGNLNFRHKTYKMMTHNYPMRYDNIQTDADIHILNSRTPLPYQTYQRQAIQEDKEVVGMIADEADREDNQNKRYNTVKLEEMSTLSGNNADNQNGQDNQNAINLSTKTMSTTAIDFDANVEEYQNKQLLQDMKRIMKNKRKPTEVNRNSDNTMKSSEIYKSDKNNNNNYVEMNDNYKQNTDNYESNETDDSDSVEYDIDSSDNIDNDSNQNIYNSSKKPTQSDNNDNREVGEQEEEEDEEDDNAGKDTSILDMEESDRRRVLLMSSNNNYPTTNPAYSTSRSDWSLLSKFVLSNDEMHDLIGVRKNFGACFMGVDSYFYYNDTETMKSIINYKTDLNLRIKLKSNNGLILWTGRRQSLKLQQQYPGKYNADYLSLGVENGYLHFRYNLGSGSANIVFNNSKINDGLWHRIRAIRDSAEGYLEVDGRKSLTIKSPGPYRKLNTDSGLYVGGVSTKMNPLIDSRYTGGIMGCISELILAGILKLNFDLSTMGTAHNVQTGLL